MLKYFNILKEYPRKLFKFSDRYCWLEIILLSRILKWVDRVVVSLKKMQGRNSLINQIM